MAKRKPKNLSIFHPNGTLRVQDPAVKAHILSGQIGELEHAKAQMEEQLLHTHLRIGKIELQIECIVGQAKAEGLELDLSPFQPTVVPNDGSQLEFDFGDEPSHDDREPTAVSVD